MIAAMPQVALPELGVGLGRVSAEWVHVHVNNRMDRDEVDAIVCVPVTALPDDPARFRLFRRDHPTDMHAPREDDVGRAIRIVRPRETERLSSHSWLPAKGGPERERVGSEPRQESRSQVAKRYVGQRVPRAYFRGAAGVLFLELSGDVELPAQRRTIAASIAQLLASPSVERCIVPSCAVEAPSDHEPEQPGALRFALASCQYTPGILDGTPRLAHDPYVRPPGPADKSYSRLAARLRAPAERPELLVLAGDQVYVDATAGLFDPTIEDGRYRKPYERLFSSTYVQDVTRQVHICAMLDDHEIEDNWEREDADAMKTLQQGVQSYIDYQRQGSLLEEPSYCVETQKLRLWSELRFAGYDFFFADTRTEREKRTAYDVHEKRMLSHTQMRRLQVWLCAGKHKPQPRFIVSPAILLPRRLWTTESPQGALLSDAWDGYPRSMCELMNFIADEGITNAVFLSGDEHLCMSATAVLEGREEVAIRSIHGSGLYTPFAFANAIIDDFAHTERLATGEGRAWRVTTRFARPGQGFALLDVVPGSESERWKVRVTFDLDTTPEPHVHEEFSV